MIATFKCEDEAVACLRLQRLKLLPLISSVHLCVSRRSLLSIDLYFNLYFLIFRMFVAALILTYKLHDVTICGARISLCHDFSADVMNSIIQIVK